MEFKEEGFDELKPVSYFPQLFDTHAALISCFRELSGEPGTSQSIDFGVNELESELVRLSCHFDRRIRTFAVKALEQITEKRSNFTSKSEGKFLRFILHQIRSNQGWRRNLYLGVGAKNNRVPPMGGMIPRLPSPTLGTTNF